MKIVHKMSFSVLGVLLLSIAVGGMIVYVSLTGVRTEMYKWFAQSGDTLAVSIGSKANEQISYFDYDSIQVMLDEEVAKDPSLVFAVVAFGDGLADSRQSGTPAKKQFQEYSAQVLDEGDVVAGVTIHYSTSILEEKLSSLMNRMVLGAFLIVAILALCLYGLVVYLVNRPLVKLVSHTKEVAAGNLSARLQIGTNDEFAQLADTFNEMTLNLRSMVSKIRRTFNDLETVAGDITMVSHDMAAGTDRQVDSVGSVSSSMEEMNSTIKSVASNVETMSKASEENSSSVLEIAASVDEVAGSAESLASSVEQTSSSINQMNSSIQAVAENVGSLSGLITDITTSLTEMDASIKEVEARSEDAFMLAEKVSDTVGLEGVQTVEKAVQGMESIRDTVLSASQVIKGLAKSSEDIGEIVNIIDGVNDQTSLLALNAAIIAAQAGEQGKSFSVVAAEIRELSDRTADSTRQISELISSVQADSKSAVTAMEKGAHSVEEGVQIIQEVNTTLLGMKENTQQASLASQSIATTTTEQAKATKQILEMAQSISEMSTEIDTATREQSAGSEQISEAAERMRNMAVQVNEATKEQARGISSIGEASERAMVMSQNILEATKEEAKGSEMIVESIQDIKVITESNQESVKGLDEMVKILTEQSQLLKMEIDRFRVDGSEEAAPAAGTDREDGSKI